MVGRCCRPGETRLYKDAHDGRNTPIQPRLVGTSPGYAFTSHSPRWAERYGIISDNWALAAGGFFPFMRPPRKAWYWSAVPFQPQSLERRQAVRGPFPSRSTMPHGHCINGFTQEPCPKLLQCTGGCSHFVNSGLDRNRSNIERLLTKTERALDEISKRSGGAGWANQLATAVKLVANLRKILSAPEGERPFADGMDLSKPLATVTALDV